MGVDKSKNDKSENSNISFPLFTKIEVNTENKAKRVNRLTLGSRIVGLRGMRQETAIFLCSPLVLFDICMYTS